MLLSGAMPIALICCLEHAMARVAVGHDTNGTGRRCEPLSTLEARDELQ
jgi:hypothetical protein